MIKFKFTFDDDFLIAAYKRYRKQYRGRYILWFVKIAISILLTFIALFVFYSDSSWASVIFIVLILLLVFGHKFDFMLYKRKFKKSPFRNEHVVITLTNEGFHGIGQKIDSKLSWNAFTKAVCFHDGFLVFLGPSVFNWLPIASLIEGTPIEVENILKDNIQQYKIFESIVCTNYKCAFGHPMW